MHIHHLSIATYPFIRLSELEQYRVKKLALQYLEQNTYAVAALQLQNSLLLCLGLRETGVRLTSRNDVKTLKHLATDCEAYVLGETWER